jgi:hypothetical protein
MSDSSAFSAAGDAAGVLMAVPVPLALGALGWVLLFRLSWLINAVERRGYCIPVLDLARSSSGRLHLRLLGLVFLLGSCLIAAVVTDMVLR